MSIAKVVLADWCLVGFIQVAERLVPALGDSEHLHPLGTWCGWVSLRSGARPRPEPRRAQ
ncbi:MAG TPA: hypothetical protein VLW50_25835 [Streptosporangiaceae bacterium]|nr:hypothetical protein [Streptosporangiaceae bacterium]